jgi:hypothetical protein
VLDEYIVTNPDFYDELDEFNEQLREILDNGEYYPTDFVSADGPMPKISGVQEYVRVMRSLAVYACANQQYQDCIEYLDLANAMAGQFLR